MKKLVFIILFAQLNFVYGQETPESVTIKEFALKSSDLKMLRNFNWNEAQNIFKDNKETDSIRIAVSYVNDKKPAENVVKTDRISAEVKGVKSDLKAMIKTAKKLTKQIVKSAKKDIKAAERQG